MDPDGGRPKLVLLIEDDALIAEAVGDMLADLGCEVQRVETVEAGAGIVETRPVMLVLSDIELPGGLDGVSFARQLKLSHPEIPLLLMTGNAARAQEAGGEFKVLFKPFGPRELVDAVTLALGAISRVAPAKE